MAEAENTSMQKFQTLLESKEYKDQAVWFLNAFWADLENAEATGEEMWELVHQFEECYHRESKGNSMMSLDLLGAAKLLEIRGETMTANARRDMLKKIDIDQDKRMSLWEYMISLQLDKKPMKGHDALWALEELMTRPQGTNQALEDAKAVLAEVNAALADYKKKKVLFQMDIEKYADKVVKLNRAKNQLAVLEANNLMTDVKFNKKQISAGAAVRKAMKLENTTCGGEVWWQDRTIKEVEKYRPNKK